MPPETNPAPDSERGARALSRSDWAWEFLRRNPSFRAEWTDLCARGAAPYRFHVGDIEVTRITKRSERAARWKLMTFRGPHA